MKLRYEIVNSGGRLVDEENNVHFTEKNLDTFLMYPILPDWREWEIEQLVEKEIEKEKKKYNWHFAIGQLLRSFYRRGYNHNKAKYTEEDLRKALKLKNGFTDEGYTRFVDNDEQIIKSLQKLPKYIVMESVSYVDEELYKIHEPKLITNSEGRQEGIIKEIIYE